MTGTFDEVFESSQLPLHPPHSEAMYQTLFEHAGDAILVVHGQTGKIVDHNPTAVQLTGFSDGELHGMSLSDIWLPDEPAPADATLLPGLAPGIARGSHRRKNGALLPVEVNSRRIEFRGEELLLLIVRDLSSHHAQAKGTAGKRDAKAVAQARRDIEELAQSKEDLAILFDISSAISKEIELGKLLDQALAMITHLGLFDVQRKGAIFLVENARLTLAAHLGLDEAFCAAHQSLKTGDCLCGLVASTGAQLVSGNIAKDKRHDITYPGMIPHGHAIVPLSTGGNTVGVLCLFLPPNKGVDERKLRLLMAIGNQLAVAIEKINLYQKTKKLSLHDPLTGLANRHFMNISLKNNMAGAKRSGRPFSLILLDLDHFKQYNDSFGHVAGDKLLSDVGSLMSREVREVDLIARYGGEEFLIILPDTGEQEALEVAERIRDSIIGYEFRYSRQRPTTRITVSAGVATYESSISEVDVLVARADAALYRAKENGRNQVLPWLTGGL
ncbi:MAG: sensor domain-containing diguanylate cyclase [Thermoleophilia bacterium]